MKIYYATSIGSPLFSRILNSADANNRLLSYYELREIPGFLDHYAKTGKAPQREGVSLTDEFVKAARLEIAAGKATVSSIAKRLGVPYGAVYGPITHRNLRGWEEPEYDKSRRMALLARIRGYENASNEGEDYADT